MKIEVASAFDVFRKSVLCFATLVSLRAFGSGTVTNCTEADFRAALAGGGQVVFACGGNLAISNTLAVSSDTLILGSGFKVTIDGGNAVQLFQVNTNVTLEIHDLMLANGSNIGVSATDTSSPGGPGFGGGILNNGGAVTLIGCTLTNLVALGGNGYIGPFGLNGGNGFGGAICNIGGTVSLTNCIFSGNQAKGGTAGGGGSTYGARAGQAQGGAIYSDGGVVGISNVRFLGNLASGGSWSNEGYGGDGAGGAVFAQNSRVFVTSSWLMGNGALGGVNLVYFGLPVTAGGNAYGGSIYLAPDSTAIFQHCSFLTNQAIGADEPDYASPNGASGSAGVGQGGAIYNLGSLQTLDSLFFTNTCKGGQLGFIPTDVGQGGAVYSTNVLLIAGCTLSGNSAVGGSSRSEHGGTYGAPGDGGAVWSSGDLRVTNSTFAGNSATGGVYPGGYGAGGGANGGGVRLAGGTGILMNVTVSGNRVDSGSTSPGSGPALGGGLSCATNATVTIRNSIIANSGNGGDTWGPLTDAGYNICSDSTANFSATGSLNNTNPLLGPLADNGGPTPTMLLLNGSPALDAIPTGFPPVDQRGVMRPQGVAADIGAVEGGKIQSVSSQIVLKPSRTDLNIIFQATAGSSYRLLASPDLVNWTPVASVSTNSSGPVQFTQPVLPVFQQFFEVESP